MITDRVVDVLAAEGYSRDKIRAAMETLVEAEWRDEDEDWYEGDLRTLRKRLGTPSADGPDEHLPDAQVEIRTESHDPQIDPGPQVEHSSQMDQRPPVALDSRTDQDLRWNAGVWAADLARVLDRTTGGSVPLSPDQIRRTADHLIHVSSGLWDPETKAPRPAGSYVPDFTVNRWADAIEEALQAATEGHIEVSRVELQVSANLLLHAQEDDWVPQAALLRAEYQGEIGETL
jgi:hypothetical protein